MAKHSLDLKREAVNSYLSGTEGYEILADRLGVGRSMLRRWVAAYKLHGIDGLKHRYRLYPSDFKCQVVQSVLRGELTSNQALAKYNIPSYTTLQSWIRLYNESGIDALQNKPRGRIRMKKQEKPSPAPECKPLQEMTREELLEELEYRRTEVAYLKKLRALVQSGQLAIKPKR